MALLSVGAGIGATHSVVQTNWQYGCNGPTWSNVAMLQLRKISSVSRKISAVTSAPCANVAKFGRYEGATRRFGAKLHLTLAIQMLHSAWNVAMKPWILWQVTVLLQRSRERRCIRQVMSLVYVERRYVNRLSIRAVVRRPTHMLKRR